MGPYFGPSYPWTMNMQVHILVPTQDHNLDPMHSSRFWFLYKSKPKIECPHSAMGPRRSMKDHIGTMVIFYIMQNMTMDLLGSSRDHTFYGPTKGPRFGPQIQVPECGPRRGTKIWSLIMGPFFGPTIGTISMWSQSRDQKLLPEQGPKVAP